MNWSGETECTRYNWIPTSAGNKRKSMPCYLWMNCTSCKMNMTLVSHKLCWTVRAVAVVHSDFYLQRLPACCWRRATAHTHTHTNTISHTHTACMRSFHAVTQAWINKTHCLIQVHTTQEQMQSIRGGIFFLSLHITTLFPVSCLNSSRQRNPNPLTFPKVVSLRFHLSALPSNGTSLPGYLKPSFDLKLSCTACREGSVLL